MLELPVAVGHVQETQRKRSPSTMAAHVPRFNYFIGDFVQRQLPDFHAEEPSQRLRLLAAHLRDMADASAAGRLRQLQEYVAYVRADLIERLQQQFDSAQDAPIYWHADVRSIIQANGRALIAGSPPRLGDWPEASTNEDCSRLLRDDCAQLADAFDAWPALWNHARERGPALLGAV